MKLFASSRALATGLVLGLLFSGCFTSPKSGSSGPDVAMAMATLEKAMAAAKADPNQTVQLDVGVDVREEDPARVQIGDVVQVEYTMYGPDGEVLLTTRKGELPASGSRETQAVTDWENQGPEEVVAGGSALFPVVGELIVGLGIGEKKSLDLPPEKAFGPLDPKKIHTFPCVRKMPRTTNIGPAEYVRAQNAFPVKGKKIQMVPYFPSEVLSVTEEAATLKHLARNGSVVEDDFGITTVGVTQTDITLILAPRMGAPFEVEGKPGRIIMTDGASFTVDLNHPLSGKTVSLELEVVSLVKASSIHLPEWKEDLDEGLEAAFAQQKPSVLLLYAPWCQWSQKLMAESFVDPRIGLIRDRFIWMKIDSDKDKDIGTAYEQKDFPLVVVLDDKGIVLGKISGFRDGGALKQELLKALETPPRNAA